MSSYHYKNIVCPQCNHSPQFKVYDSINLVLDPHLKEKLLSEELLRFKCSNCKSEKTIIYPILINDMENKIMYQYAEGVENKEEALKKFKKNLESVIDYFQNSFNYQYRFVVSLSDLKEKLFIMDAGLDDRIVEIVKYIYFDMLEKSMLGVIEKLLFLKDKGDCYFIAIGDDEESIFSIKMDMELYQNVRSDINLESIEGFVIDQEWARNFISKINI